MFFYNFVKSIPNTFQPTLQYQPEFNPRVHGPYDPSKFYGKGNITYQTHEGIRRNNEYIFKLLLNENLS